MEITLEAIEKRLAEYEHQKGLLLADLNAVDGAIQDCQYWQKKLAGDSSESPDSQEVIDEKSEEETEGRKRVAKKK